MDPEVEEFLAHFGVKGQKWGVRKEKKAPRLSRGMRQKLILGAAATLYVGSKFVEVRMNTPSVPRFRSPNLRTSATLGKDFVNARSWASVPSTVSQLAISR